MMDLDTFAFLLTPAGERLLRETAETTITPENHLQMASHLRQQVTAERAQAILETVLLRQLAVVKFSRAAEMFFTRPALEQASSEVVSMYRAARFARAGFQAVADLGCGIGGDAVALAAQAQVTGVDWDPVRLVMAQENVRVYGHGERFEPLQADLTALSPTALSEVEALFFDPARRDERGRRFFSLHHYQPPFSVVAQWRQVVAQTAVKISPGVDYEELPDEAEAEIEFISVRGEVKEGVLWFGDLHSGVGRRATLLPAGDTLTDKEMGDEAVAVTPPKQYLYEPDKAVIRAHLVTQLAQRLGASQIDREIAYLTADVCQPTPFARCFSLEAYFPFQLKRLRHYLRERGVGQVTIKKRGSPLEPDVLQRRLRLRGENSCILFLTQIDGKAAVLVGQPYHHAV